MALALVNHPRCRPDRRALRSIDERDRAGKVLQCTTNRGRWRGGGGLDAPLVRATPHGAETILFLAVSGSESPGSMPRRPGGAWVLPDLLFSAGRFARRRLQLENQRHCSQLPWDHPQRGLPGGVPGSAWPSGALWSIRLAVPGQAEHRRACVGPFQVRPFDSAPARSGSAAHAARRLPRGGRPALSPRRGAASTESRLTVQGNRAWGRLCPPTIRQGVGHRHTNPLW